MKVKKIKEFTEYPGPRYKVLGDDSGEEFRDEILIPFINENGVVVVDLDGVIGYGSSFLEEAFAGLLRNGIDKFIVQEIVNNLKSEDDPELINEIRGYVQDELEK